MIKLPRKLVTTLTHISVWVIFLTLPIIFDAYLGQPLPEKILDLPPAGFRRTFSVILNIVLISLFYLNYSLLLPRFYLKGKTRLYFFFVFLIYCTFQFAGFIMRHFVFAYLNTTVNMETITRMSIAVSTIFFILIWGASSGFRLAEEWRRTENKRREAERGQLEAQKNQLKAELNLLKSQINPHFLLNSLNNLYALALTDHEKTPAALLKLSEMVAYILYECDKPTITLNHDLKFIKNYIALQKMRLSSNITLHVEMPGRVPALDIEPMLLIPFIENAFKHGLTTNDPCEVSISIQIAEGQLKLRVENEIFKEKNASNRSVSGIGIANTMQRLAYAYPERHQLDIQKKQNKHLVELTLELRAGWEFSA